jgi:hypothetical protein
MIFLRVRHLDRHSYLFVLGILSKASRGSPDTLSSYGRQHTIAQLDVLLSKFLSEQCFPQVSIPDSNRHAEIRRSSSWQADHMGESPDLGGSFIYRESQPHIVW